MRIFFIILLTLSLALALWWLGIFSYFSNLERLQSDIESLGAIGLLLYFLAFLITFPIGIHPGLVWISGYIWPLPLAILYSTLAGLLAGLVVFLLTRRFFQRWARDRLPERVKRYEVKLEENPLKTLVTLRLLLWINILVDLLIGVSRVSVRQYFTTAIVVVPPVTTIHVLVARYWDSVLIRF